jgi:hypothetical protein
MYYSCSVKGCDCGYDICRMCALQNCDPPFLNKGVRGTLFPEIHKCALKPHGEEHRSNFECDIADICPDDPVCEQHLQKCGYRSEFVYGLQCRECDFDICLGCVIRRVKKGQQLQSETYLKYVAPKVKAQPPAQQQARPVATRAVPTQITINGQVIQMAELRRIAAERCNIAIEPRHEQLIRRATIDLVRRL